MKIIKFCAHWSILWALKAKDAEWFKNIECDIEEYTLHGKNQLQGTDKSLYLLLSLLDFADINQICPYLIERRKLSVRHFARIMAGNENING